MWSQVVVPVVAGGGWSRDDVLSGLRALERLRRRVDAATSWLLQDLDLGGRDVAAAVSTSTKISPRAAREQILVARVVGKLPAAGDALANGSVSIEHLRLLKTVAQHPDALTLVELAKSQSAREFASTVAKFELANHQADVRDRQKRNRSVSYFRADHGCVGVRAVLTPLEGEEFRNRLTAVADRQWRARHPVRAEVLRGNDDEPYPSRLADALMSLIRGEDAVATAKPAVVVSIDAATLEAEVVGGEPIALGDAFEMAARADLYACIRTTEGAILEFGRNRRLASVLQRLALIVRDKTCVYPGCDAHWTRTEAHHVREYEHGGSTDIDNLARVCPQHHRHLHLNGLTLRFVATGWTIHPRPPPDVSARDRRTQLRVGRRRELRLGELAHFRMPARITA